MRRSAGEAKTIPRDTALLLLLAGAVAAGCGGPASEALQGPAAEAVRASLEGGTASFGHAEWDELLAAAVREGRAALPAGSRRAPGAGGGDPGGDGGAGVPGAATGVDYAHLARQRALLDAYLARVARADLARLSPDHLEALLVNAYNAYTVRTILEHPDVSSIREIDGVWTERTHRVGGFDLTLDEIEHGLLRPFFRDPRVHFLVNCASRSCAPLPPRAFRGDSLEAQKERRTRAFLRDPANVRVEGGKLLLSAYFDWYGEDFVAEGWSPSAETIPLFVARYASPEVAEFVRSHDGRPPVAFLAYDWCLNAATPPGETGGEDARAVGSSSGVPPGGRPAEGGARDGRTSDGGSGAAAPDDGASDGSPRGDASSSGVDAPSLGPDPGAVPLRSLPAQRTARSSPPPSGDLFGLPPSVRTAGFLQEGWLEGIRAGMGRAVMELREWVEGLGVLGMLVYGAVYVAATLLLLPGSAITVGAGVAFGLLWGTVLVSLASTVGAGLCFLLARHLLRDRVESRIRGNRKFAMVDRAVGERGWKIVALTRLSPVFPFNLQNYAYGLTAVSFRGYLLASWVAMIPGTLLYVYLGAAGVQVAEAATGAADWGRTALQGVGLLATLGVAVVAGRIATRVLREAGVEDEAGAGGPPADEPAEDGGPEKGGSRKDDPATDEPTEVGAA